MAKNGPYPLVATGNNRPEVLGWSRPEAAIEHLQNQGRFTTPAGPSHRQLAVIRLFVDGTERARPGERLYATSAQSVEADADQAHAATSVA